MDGMTPVPTDQVELIRKNAAMVREALADAEGADAGFGAEGAAQLDRYIESVRATAGNPAMLGQMFGCHLGESLIAAFGGEWVFTPEGLGVRLAPALIAYPLAKCAKQMESGQAESVRAYFATTDALLRARNAD